MTTRRPSLLLPNVRDPQTEASWKSIKAVLDYQQSMLDAPSVVSANNITSLQAQITALQAAVTALQAQVAALTDGNQFTASGMVNAGQAVYCPSPGFVVVASYTDLAQATSLVGIALTTAVSGAKVTVAGPGQFAANIGSLPNGPVYLGANGTLLDSPPPVPLVTAFVGYAVGSRILVQLNGPQQVYNNDTPAIDYPAISYSAVQGYPSLYLQQVNE